MFDLDFPRDLIVTGAIFGTAAFVWAGWAQERPPHWAWRIYLAAIAVAGATLAGISILFAVRNWASGTVIAAGAAAFTIYLVVVTVEVVVLVLGAVILVRTGRGPLAAPFALLIVGTHFFALGLVFGQPIMHVAAVLLTAVAVAAFVLPKKAAAPSFWCGTLGAPGFLGVGAACLAAGVTAL